MTRGDIVLMPPRRHVARHARAVLALALAATTAACTTWRPREGPVTDAVRAQAERAGRPARLTLRDGRELTLDSLAVRGDSAIGYTRRRPPERVAVPLADVVRVAERRVDAGETAAKGLTGVGIAGVALFVLALVFMRDYAEP